jgi:hypothetical protein
MKIEAALENTLTEEAESDTKTENSRRPSHASKLETSGGDHFPTIPKAQINKLRARGSVISKQNKNMEPCNAASRLKM